MHSGCGERSRPASAGAQFPPAARVCGSSRVAGAGGASRRPRPSPPGGRGVAPCQWEGAQPGVPPSHTVGPRVKCGRRSATQLPAVPTSGTLLPVPVPGPTAEAPPVGSALRRISELSSRLR